MRIAARVRTSSRTGPTDDPTQAEFEPEQALSVRREARRGGTCATRAGLVVLELWRQGYPARVAQLAYDDGEGHVVAEVWSAEHATWVAVNPSRGAYLTRDDNPAPATNRLQSPMSTGGSNSPSVRRTSHRSPSPAERCVA